ncbi:MAG: ATP-dependent helicase [Evtepia sp.]|uniref:ATP-dependent helicase n=1 Tax=Evtepia sp. TaxID=2773933 RepID=UPI002A7515FE|nr:ATP-dependent helicase [Evtepia sp.]MDY3014080.1 ATP-dependent helicase [Evtepia sp.]
MTYEAWKQRWPVALNPQQEAAVQAAEGPVLLLAVPGSGKTTVLILRLGYMIFCRQIPPEEILTVTYTVSATRDMAARFASFFGQEMAARLEFRTINGLSARIIRRYEQVKGRRAFQLVTDERKLSALVGELCREATGEFASESTIKAVRTAITYIKNRQLSAQEIEALQPDDLPAAEIYRKYCACLRQNGWMDYDDQMVYAAQILRQYPDILVDFQRQYRYLCVDEAQDTSTIQHRIIALLAGKDQNLFMVGDEDQSIYGFRAADPSALMQFEQRYPRGRVLLMETNYRSCAPIVTAADRFIGKNQNRREKHMRAFRGEGPAVREWWVYDRSEQYDQLVKEAASCRRETAVLYRNNDSALPLLDRLNRKGIGYRCRQVEGSFFSYRIVRDVSALIRFAQDPADGEIFLQIYYKLRAGISKLAAQWAVQESDGVTPILALVTQAPGVSPWTQRTCQGLATHFSRLLEERGDRAIYRIAHFMGYGDYVKERGGDWGKLEILEALGRETASPLELLDRLDELSGLVKAGSSDEESPFLLSTIHSSKGLEYDRVILADVADGILPSVPPPEGEHPDPEEWACYEEERRLFYVGMTRAKEELTIVRFRRGDLASTFAREIFPEKKQEKRKKPPSVPTKKVVKTTGGNPEEFLPGVGVTHKRFGVGEVVSKQGDIVSICFDSGEEKRFSLSVALRQGQLRKGT